MPAWESPGDPKLNCAVGRGTNRIHQGGKGKGSSRNAAISRCAPALADNDVGRESYGGGVPVVEGVDVVHVVFVGADGAREMVVFADANGIVRRGAFGWGDFPPDAGNVVGLVGLATADFAGALDGVEIVIEECRPM
jgi:hypothetical protein